MDLEKRWIRYSGNPVLCVGGSGEWDESCAGFGSVLGFEGGFRMYYTGFNGLKSQSGMAFSKDGFVWEKYKDNPILKNGGSGEWDEVRADLPMVWREGGRFHMLYRGMNSKGVVQVGYAKSEDGVIWEKNEANPVFNDQRWCRNHTEPWGLIKIGNKYLLWYSYLNTKHGRIKSMLFGKPRQESCAVSKNLIDWEPVQDEPIFKSSGKKSDWNYHQFCPDVFKLKNFYYILIVCRSAKTMISKLALYRSKNPFFPSDERELIGVSLCNQGIEWEEPYFDTPWFLADDITKSSFDLTGKDLWCYYTAGSSKSLQTGLTIKKLDFL